MTRRQWPYDGLRIVFEAIADAYDVYDGADVHIGQMVEFMLDDERSLLDMTKLDGMAVRVTIEAVRDAFEA